MKCSHSQENRTTKGSPKNWKEEALQSTSAEKRTVEDPICILLDTKAGMGRERSNVESRTYRSDILHKIMRDGEGRVMDLLAIL